ncbi:1-phosphofructokinase family hexose kinase [Fervidibacillus albus]|uniref:Tagatose-6-phosphate kinase n=1 Tax=Fervidibacillus albus TaxID=2980026 RepID=A0A9E8LTF3_9BACI|nr:1-phosphofructokinase family hexose kinase [Fervidibacillus albus]WAA09298.1 1-phosphofructokinase family hexose kinase [Fervidibacillus albus]
MYYTITLNPAIDRLLFLDQKMESRKTNRITNVDYDIGGKGTHGSYAMSKLGVDNVALGFMGELNSDAFQQIMDVKGITNQFTSIQGQKTRECYIVIDQVSTGTTMLTEKGFKVSKQDIDTFMDQLKKTVKKEDTVLIAGSLPEGFTINDLKRLVHLLKQIGCFIACDLSGDALKVAVDLGVDFIKPNEFEINDLNEDKEDLIPFLKGLNKTIQYIVVSMGKNGSYFLHNQQVFRVISPNVHEVNDTGAGDCFVGSFMAGLAKNFDLEETLRLASACAASKVMHNDSTTFDLDQVEQLKYQVQIQKY